jgi:hypothetical protein
MLSTDASRWQYDGNIDAMHYNGMHNPRDERPPRRPRTYGLHTLCRLARAIMRKAPIDAWVVVRENWRCYEIFHREMLSSQSKDGNAGDLGG